MHDPSWAVVTRCSQWHREFRGGYAPSFLARSMICIPGLQRQDDRGDSQTRGRIMYNRSKGLPWKRRLSWKRPETDKRGGSELWHFGIARVCLGRLLVLSGAP